MAQFDVHRNPHRATRREVPYLLDVQADLLDVLATRVVVPLVAASAMKEAAKDLNPRFRVEGRSVVMSSPELAGVPLKALGERVTSLKSRRDEIVRALDILIAGI